ncbi:type IV-A pilus assembly ATPase PilB [Halofilum ochraceum]|uniref:type IV-A pilus assembly ATPase PilB n=1 Tax=Halofilum ochraceum TaxID=1611323 RepID=UPI0008D8E41C|nr:type IV-A pilus assembly ATPase PilB [Halofilum ochraceum]
MATPNPKLALGGIVRRLVHDGILSDEDARAATEGAQKEKQAVVRYLVGNKQATGRQVATAAMQEFGLPLVDLDTLDPEVQPVSLVEHKLIEKHRAVPLHKRGNRLYLGIADPTNMVALDEFKFATGLTTEPVLVEDDKLTRRIDQILSAQEMGSGVEDLDEDLENLDVGGDDEDADAGDVSRADADDTPVVRYVNKVLLDAINRGASDIHIEPYEKYMRVRYRIDGVLLEIAKPPLAMSHRLIARIKVMSRMDISERRLPQDGRIKMKISRQRAIDFRVNTCPTLFGEKVVLRILDPSSAQMGIEKLGYEEDQKQLYMDALSKPYGMILVTGPTGSGKTVSLYTGLNILNTADRNISTAEDPAEINLAGINQVNVNNKVGLTFAEALRSFLRQDPDVIMVGEVRDLETAEIAIKAAQTGHMVLSTLHTNDAPQTLSRMINMGVPPFNVATAVSLIIAQRLGRRLCEQCKALDDIPREALIEEGFTEDEVDDLKLYKAVGCSQCNDTGYKGRVGIYQVMPVTDAIGRIMMEGGNSLDIADQAEKEGVADLRTSALKKVRAGVMSLEEANRITVD